MLEELCRRASVDPSSFSVVKTKGEKTKSEKVKRKSGPTAWSDWTKKVLAENKEAIKAFTAAAPTKLGAHLKWLSANKGKECPEWKAYQAEWLVAHPKESKEVEEVEEVEEVDGSEGSEVSAPSKSSGRRGPKKLDEMTTEEKAAHVASIAARRVKKEAEKVAKEAAGKAESVSMASSASVASVASEEKPKKKSSYVAVADMTPEQLIKYKASQEKAKAAKAAKAGKEVVVKVVTKAEPVAEPEAKESESEGEMELIPFVFDNKPHFRLGTKAADGTIAWESDLWISKDGKRGAYVGTLEEDGSVDTDAEEPMIE